MGAGLFCFEKELKVGWYEGKEHLEGLEGGKEYYQSIRKVFNGEKECNKVKFYNETYIFELRKKKVCASTLGFQTVLVLSSPGPGKMAPLANHSLCKHED